MQPLVSRVWTILVLLAITHAAPGDDLTLPSEKIEAAADMMSRYLRRQADQTIQRWKVDYEKTQEAGADYRVSAAERIV